ncbi:hypothetical protein OMR58_04920 [Erwinia sp. INIA-01]|uniref:hypothetical protein n=1 Tax=Erwinia sp. INIA01 TaxID=2991500 RepID=UPI002224F48E|nr:hypothetical protein [Erwinia sp. INIA01]MCW1873785.1 hypothetical protein [Erwinia sp. INIA01]
MSVTGAQMALTVAGMRVNVAGHTLLDIFSLQVLCAGERYGAHYVEHFSRFKCGGRATVRGQNAGSP